MTVQKRVLNFGNDRKTLEQVDILFGVQSRRNILKLRRKLNGNIGKLGLWKMESPKEICLKEKSKSVSKQSIFTKIRYSNSNRLQIKYSNILILMHRTNFHKLIAENVPNLKLAYIVLQVESKYYEIKISAKFSSENSTIIIQRVNTKVYKRRNRFQLNKEYILRQLPRVTSLTKKQRQLESRLSRNIIVFSLFFRLVPNRATITVEFPAGPACFSDSTFVSFAFSSHPIFAGEGGWKIEGGTG